MNKIKPKTFNILEESEGAAKRRRTDTISEIDLESIQDSHRKKANKLSITGGEPQGFFP